MVAIRSPFKQVGAARTLAVACLAILLVGGFFMHARVNKDPGAELARVEAGNVMKLASSLWTGTPDRDFSAVSTHKALEEKFVPAPMLRPSGPPVRNSWGTEVQVLPYQIRDEGDAFMIRYRDLPPSACRALVEKLGPSLYDVQIHRWSVMAGGRAVASDVANACQGTSATVDFIYQPEFIPGTAMKQPGRS